MGEHTTNWDLPGTDLGMFAKASNNKHDQDLVKYLAMFCITIERKNSYNTFSEYIART